MDVNKEVADRIAEIKAHMPEVYGMIQSRAQADGPGVFGLVRRGLRGEANCFYAFERGRVMGTVFSAGDLQAEVARYMVQFGVRSVCIIGKAAAA